MNLDLISATAILLLSGLGAIILGVGGNEAYAWLPSFARLIVRAASKRIQDSTVRERAQEEWQSLIEEIPGYLWRVVHALSLFITAKRIEEEWLLESLGGFSIEWADLESAARQFCRKLHEARVRAGITVPDIAACTKISVEFLEALEEGDWNVLPQGIYIVNWLAQYADLVGLDAAEVVEEYWQTVMRIGAHPPRRQRASLRARIACGLLGHHNKEINIHNEHGVFHWHYVECLRCFRTTQLHSSVCDCEWPVFSTARNVRTIPKSPDRVA